MGVILHLSVLLHAQKKTCIYKLRTYILEDVLFFFFLAMAFLHPIYLSLSIFEFLIFKSIFHLHRCPQFLNIPAIFFLFFYHLNACGLLNGYLYSSRFLPFSLLPHGVSTPVLIISVSLLLLASPSPSSSLSLS